MNYRQLGKTGISISEIGFGTWGLGGTSGGSVSYGPTEDAESRSALRAALDKGINFFDTADLYGFGHSETLLGDYFHTFRDKVIIASKGGFSDAKSQDFSPEYLREALEGSLRRLRTDYVDLYQLHSPSLEELALQPGAVHLLNDLQQEGKIRAWGISARSPDEARVAIEKFNTPVVQVNFNLTDQRARENGLFELCQSRGCGVIVRTPLCFGFLTGTYSGAASFDPMDHRSRWPREQVHRWQQAADDFQCLLNTHSNETPCQLALRFCLSFPAVSSVIPGMLTPAQVHENAIASDLGPLPAAEIDATSSIYTTKSFFVRSAK